MKLATGIPSVSGDILYSSILITVWYSRRVYITQQMDWFQVIAFDIKFDMYWKHKKKAANLLYYMSSYVFHFLVSIS